MNTRIVCVVVGALAAFATGARAQHAPHASLPAFRSDRELARYLERVEQAPVTPPPAPSAPQPPAPQVPAPPACTAPSALASPSLTWEGPSGEWPAVVSGRVTNVQGCPEAAVLVRIESLDAGATTGADGTYRLVIPAGRVHAGKAVNITVSRTGLSPVTRSITLSPGASLTQNFTMAAQIVLLEDVVVTGASVTNSQHAGVDEGAIVKLHGNFLVILRRGRLFTVDVSGGGLRPVSMVNAFGPEEEDPDAWYDEMLVSGDLVVVIGYSYERGGTEINLFRIDRAGRLHYRETHHLRSDDYYSSRNYASRLIGTRLVMYAPVPTYADEPAEWMPAVRRWRPGAEDDELGEEDGFRRILRPGRVYRPGQPLRWYDDPTLHTVTTCELGSGRFDCEATAVLGPEGRVFYVSPSAVYVWTGGSAPRGEPASSVVYRIPLDGGAPASLGVEGSPVDQFSFLESGDGHLNVLVRSDARGDGMWDAERAGGDVRLLRVPIRRFGAGRAAARDRDYRALPAPGETDAFNNRFVGSYLLYGTGNGWWDPSSGQSVLYAVRWADGRVAQVPLAHGVDRIEVMGADAVVVGADSADLHFTGIRLGRQPRAAQRYVQRGAQQGELRSHGFFYRADGPQEGVIGLPVRGPGAPGYAHLVDGSASVLFLQNQDERFRALGELAANPEGETDDDCIASCVDWYGNARPLFLRGRILALLGYEIVEGAVMDGRIREVQRARFTPSAVLAVSR